MPLAVEAHRKEPEAMDKDARSRADRSHRRVQEDVPPKPDEEHSWLQAGNTRQDQIGGKHQKITKAMEMVAASKMRKAQDRMRAARTLARRCATLLRNLAKANPEYVHPFMQIQRCTCSWRDRSHHRQGVCAVASNTNVLRAVTNKLRELQEQGVRVQAVAIGNKGLGFLNRVGAKVVCQYDRLGRYAALDKLIGPVKVLLDAYAEGKINAVYLAYTKFINTMKQESVVEQLLPLSSEQMKADASGSSWDYIYEPDAQTRDR